jgi:hypothetical protein
MLLNVTKAKMTITVNREKKWLHMKRAFAVQVLISEEN